MTIKSIIIIAIVLSLGIQDLKLSFGGISIGTIGDPFLYEILMISFIVITVVKIITEGIIDLDKPYRLIFLLFVVLFAVNFMLEPDYKYLLGLGSLRMFLFSSSFFLCATFYTYDNNDLKYVIYAFVIIGVVNALYSLLLYYSIFQPIFPYAKRLGFMRYAGFSQSPAYAGPMFSTAIALLVPFAVNRKNILSLDNVPLFILTTLAMALVLSMSRSGMVAVLGSVVLYLLLRRRYLQSLYVGLIFSLLFYRLANVFERRCSSKIF